MEAALVLRVPCTWRLSPDGAPTGGRGPGAGNGAVCWGWGGFLLGCQAPVWGQLQQDEGDAPEADQHGSGPGAVSGPRFSPRPLCSPGPARSSTSVTRPPVLGAGGPCSCKGPARCSGLLPVPSGPLGQRRRGWWWVTASGLGPRGLRTSHPGPGVWVAEA